MKYTAYSGWISSGLVSWSIDKVLIVDSFGKSLSVCKRGLLLESGHPVYLPLYPGECNIPAEPETTTMSETTSYTDQFAQEKQGGIGPFTKDQNFGKEQSFLTEVVTEKQMARPHKGLGPFTKDQNPKPFIAGAFRPQDIFSKMKKVFASEASSESSLSQITNPWAVADLTDGDSNSLDNFEAESGRGFSESTSSQRTLTSTNSPQTFKSPGEDLSSEIHEPVLKSFGKETGRSLKLPEITEPILRLRATRQNEKSNGNRRSGRGKQRPESSQEISSRSFTVQFLPERLAGILAHAERYARQTLLPLISQYTPSFVGGARHNKPMYFPPLGDIVNESLEDSNSREIVNSERIVPSFSSSEEDGREEEEDYSDSSYEFKSRTGKTINSGEDSTTSNNSSFIGSAEFDSSPKGKADVRSAESREENEEEIREAKPGNFSSSSQESEGKWLTEEGASWSHEEAGAESETKIDDWIPMVPTEERKEKKEAIVPAAEGIENRKFIPLIDFANPDEYFVSSTSRSADGPSINETTTEDDGHDGNSTTTSSHIQRIPSRTDGDGSTKMPKSLISTVFPYIYERKNDPRTRYIPLLPEEDMRQPIPGL